MGQKVTATGLSPAMALYSKRLAVPPHLPAITSVYTWHRYSNITKHSLHAGLVLVHSPLLKESRLFSLPPLNNMLKFSG